MVKKACITRLGELEANASLAKNGDDSMRRSILVSMLATLVCSYAHAADVDAPSSPVDNAPIIDEVRLGGLAHAPWSPEAGGADLNAEVLFAKPWGTADQWWLPRPHLGTTLNFEGKTSTVYAGVSWQYNISDWGFVEASFGGSLNNGQTEDYHNDMNPLGCKALFRESASIGYNITAHWRIMATAEHNSNGGLCDYNRGLTNYGLRIGYKF